MANGNGLANEQIRQLTAVLAALLIDKHRGRALLDSKTLDMAYGDPAQRNGYLVNIATLKPLGTHRLQVVLPNGKEYVPAPEVIEAENKPSGPCGDDWHRHGFQGLRCPKCGSTERII